MKFLLYVSSMVKKIFKRKKLFLVLHYCTVPDITLNYIEYEIPFSKCIYLREDSFIYFLADNYDGLNYRLDKNNINRLLLKNITKKERKFLERIKNEDIY